METNDCENKFIDFVHFLEVFPIIIPIVIILVVFGSIFQLLAIDMLLILLLSLILYLFYLFKKTGNLIQNFPERGSENPHHAIILAHKEDPISEKFNFFEFLNYLGGEYVCGIDILINEFQFSSKEINYKIYEVTTKEQVIPIFMNDRTTHLWIFGHGQRNKLRFKGGDLCYFEIRNAPQKVFIGQYHCNSIYGRSFGDYNKPKNQDITHFLRWGPFIRSSVRKKIKELKLKALLRAPNGPN
jgi:hypothetical protein